MQYLKEDLKKIFNKKFWTIILPTLLVLWLVFYAELIFGGKFLWEDQLNYFYPLRAFAASSFDKWGITFWNPYMFAGVPFIADVQTAYFYPTNLLFNIFYTIFGGLGYGAYQIFALSHVLLMSVATFVAVKIHKKSNLMAIFFAIFYTYASFNALHFIHFSFIQTTLFFPLIISLFAKFLQTRNNKVGVAISALVAISFLGGYAQYLYGLMLFLGVFWLYNIITKKSYKNKKFVLAKAFALVYVGLGIMLAMFQWIPALDFTKETTRKDLTLADSQISSVGFDRAINFVSPRFYGEISQDAKEGKTPYWWGSQVNYEYWESAIFFGVIPFLMFIVAIIGLKKKEKILALSVFAFLFALMLGKNFFLYELFFNYFPGFDMFRNAGRYSYFLLLFVFFVLLFKSDKTIAKINLKPTLIVAGSVSGFALMFFILTKYPNEAVKAFSMNQILIAISFVVAFLVAMKFKTDKKIFWGILILALFIDLKLADSNFSSAEIDPEVKHGAKNPARQFMSTKDEHIRMQTRSGRMMIWERNSGMVNGIEMVEGYNPLMLDDFYKFWFQFKCPIRAEMLNVKYALNLERGNVVRLNQWDRYFFTNKIIKVNSIFDYNDLLEKSDARGTFALVTEDIEVESMPPQEGQTITNSLYTPDRQIFSVSTPENSLFISNEVYYKSFKAKLDGKETKIHKVNGIHRGVVVPKGSHTLEIYYDKTIFYFGGAVSLIALVLLVLVYRGKREQTVLRVEEK